MVDLRKTAAVRTYTNGRSGSLLLDMQGDDLFDAEEVNRDGMTVIDISTPEGQFEALMERSKYFYIKDLKFEYKPEDPIFSLS